MTNFAKTDWLVLFFFVWGGGGGGGGGKGAPEIGTHT